MPHKFPFHPAIPLLLALTAFSFGCKPNKTSSSQLKQNPTGCELENLPLEVVSHIKSVTLTDDYLSFKLAFKDQQKMGKRNLAIKVNHKNIKKLEILERLKKSDNITKVTITSFKDPLVLERFLKNLPDSVEDLKIGGFSSKKLQFENQPDIPRYIDKTRWGYIHDLDFKRVRDPSLGEPLTIKVVHFKKGQPVFKDIKVEGFKLEGGRHWDQRRIDLHRFTKYIVAPAILSFAAGALVGGVVGAPIAGILVVVLRED